MAEAISRKRKNLSGRWRGNWQRGIFEPFFLPLYETTLAMTITLELSETLERQLRTEAARNGISVNKQIVQSLSDNDATPDGNASTEEQLSNKIMRWIPAHQHKTYLALVEKRRAGAISQSEYEDLLLLTDVVETAHAVRMRHLIQLADLRNISLENLLLEIGIAPAKYA